MDNHVITTGPEKVSLVLAGYLWYSAEVGANTPREVVVISVLEAVYAFSALISFMLMFYYGFQGFIIHKEFGVRGFLSVTGMGVLFFSILGLFALGKHDSETLLLLRRLQFACGIITIPAWLASVYLFFFPDTSIPKYIIIAAVLVLFLLPGSILLSRPVMEYQLDIFGRQIRYYSGTPRTGLLVLTVLIAAGYVLGAVKVLASGLGWKKKSTGFLLFTPGIAGIGFVLFLKSAVFFLAPLSFLTSLFLMVMSLLLLFEDKRQYRELHLTCTDLEQRVQEQLETITELNEELMHNTIQDPLTGLYNRKEMYDRLTSELSRTSRHGREFVLVYIDLDHFEYYNEEYGHYAGDFVLREFARILVNTTRSADSCARFGSDEFMLLLPETRVEGAVKVLENIWAVLGTRNGFSEDLSEFLQREISVPPDKALNCCAGVVAVGADEQPGSLEDIILAAGNALAEAKNESSGTYRISAGTAVEGESI